MTIEEKRRALSRFCDNFSDCSGCKLHGNKVCKCGFGYSFDNEFDKTGYMTDAEIIGAYEMIFGSTETETISCELVSDDNLITISGVDKISNISIYFKEDNNNGN